MSGSEEDSSIFVKRLYARYTKDGIITPQSLVTWFVDYLNYPFMYDEKCKSNFGFFKDPKDTKNHPFQIVSFITRDALQSNTILRFSEKTELFCLYHSYRFTFVVDFSWSTLCSSADGTCYVNSIVKTINQIFYILSEPSSYSFPGTGYKLSNFTVFCSVIVVVPNSKCYTLLSGWVVNTKEIPNKIAYISRSLVKLERTFLEDIKNKRDDSKYTGRRYVFLSDLLRHGALSVSLLTPISGPATILFFTHGCFATSDFGVPELVMSHLNVEHVRCVFILMTDNIIPDVHKPYIPHNMSKQSSLMTAGIQQVELCSVLASNTDGFVVNIPHALPYSNLELSSMFSRLPLPIQMITLNDLLLAHVYEFNRDPFVRKVPDSFANRLYPVFVMKNNLQGDLVATPILQDLQPTNNPDYLSILRFIDYWRLFIDIDLVQCYRWMDLHHIFLLLEYDSPLPPNLHFPPSDKRDASPLSCRQALFRVHTLLSQWSSFVLLENSTYIKLFHIGDFAVGRLVHKSSSLSSISSVPGATQETMDAKKVSECDVGCNKTCSGVSMSSVSHFCLIRLELKIPEVRFCIGFVNNTPVDIQHEIMEYLKTQLKSLHFPPRGRQAIPKSRHKSGTFQHVAECKHVPPLQRSWEDTPCCTVFNTRLDRLVIDFGTFCNPVVKASDCISTNKNKSVKLDHTQESERVSKSCKQNRLLFLQTVPVNDATINPLLLAQHLYHSVCVWAVFSSTWKSCMQSIFSSLVNIRLQEGFHLARVGPQSGFVSLLTELEMQSLEISNTETPCLVQYQVYPTVDPKNVEFQGHDLGHLTVINNFLKSRIDAVVLDMLNSPDSSTVPDIKKSSFSPIIIASEIWIQPVDGIINSVDSEAENWSGSTFSELPRIIFNEDEECIVSYITLDNLYNFVTNKSTVCIGSPKKITLLGGDAYFPLECSTEICLVYSSISRLISRCSNLIALFPLLGSVVNKKPSSNLSNNVHNQRLLTSFQSRLLNSGLLVEVPVSVDELKTVFIKWGCNINSEFPENTDIDLPKLRCFVGRGSLKQSVVDSDVIDEPNPMVTMILIPATIGDVFHPIMFSILTNHLENSDASNHPSLPVFIYACSRVYMSYLIDDKWTYKAPDTHIIDMRSNDRRFLQSDKHECNIVGKLYSLPCEVPDCFLNVGCQNERLTQELHALWSDLMFYTEILEHSYSYGFSVAIYRIILHNSIPDAKDVNYILRHSEVCFPIQPLYVDLTSFSLLTCSHLFPYVHLLHKRSNKYLEGSICSKHLPALGCEKPKQSASPLCFLDSEDLAVEFYMSSANNCDCCEIQRSCLFSTFTEYLKPVPNLDGVYVLSKSKLTCQGNRTIRRSVSQNILKSWSKAINISGSREILSQTDTRNAYTSSVTCNLSEASGESEALWDSRTLKSNKEVSHCNHSISHSSDSLLRKLVEWFHLVTENSPDICPLFLRIRGILEYKGTSINVPLCKGIPTFCASHFHGLLSELILKKASQHSSSFNHKVASMSNSSALKIDLRELYFYIEILPIVRPHSDLFPSHKFNDSIFKKSRHKNKTDMNSGRVRNQHLETSDIFHCSFMSSSYSINMAYSTMEEECIVIDDWLNQNYVSKIPSIQQCFLRLFIFQMLWHIHDKSVNCMRSLTPVTEKSLETVLQHIEDTCKAIHTPLFNPCSMLVNHSYISSEDELSKSNIDFEKSSAVVEQLCTVAPNFRSLRKQVRMQRIHLDFVSYDTDVVDQFAKYFESMLVSHSYGSLQYINGYYYLSSFEETSESVLEKRHTKRSCRDGNTTNYFPGVGNFSSGFQDPSVTMDKISSHQSSFPDSMAIAHTSQKRALARSLKYQTHMNVSYVGNEWCGNKGSYLSKQNPCRTHRSYSLSSFDSHYSKKDNEAVFKSNLVRSSMSLSESNSRKSIHSLVLDEYIQSSNKSMPFWFIFRICSNSVSVFFHHTDLHIKSIHGQRQCQDLSLSKFALPKNSSYQTYEDILLLECPYCTIYQNVVNSIYSVIRMLNQKLLLKKLYDERLCDQLLLPPDEVDMITKREVVSSSECDESNTRNGSFNASNFRGWKVRNRHHLRSFIHHIPPTDKEKAAFSCHKLKTHSNNPSHIDRTNCIKSSRIHNTKHSVNIGGNQKKLQLRRKIWPPGVFACPVQMTSYIYLHPRVFLNCQIYSVEKGRRIIPVLRRLLENLAITNRSNMFFLIDHPSKTDSISAFAKQKRQAYCDSEVQLIHSSESSQDPVFYMLLKEITTATFSSEQQSGLLDKRTSQTEPKHLLEPKLSTKINKVKHISSDVLTSTYFGSSEETSKNIHKGIRFAGNLKKTYKHNDHIGENVLQITLHGISQPSRRLCSSVHHMLQTRLDGLVLQHISDSLSRNAINRLTLEDFTFLLNRRIEHPLIHFYIALPKFLTGNDRSLFVSQAVLSFCHYFRQNLLLFLTPVKIDDDTKKRLKELGKAELYLFNRPSAQGFSKHGVATILIQLMITSGDKTPQKNYSFTRPYVITESTSSDEPACPGMSCNLCFQDMSKAIRNFSEVSKSDLQKHPVPRLVLSVRMWERGHSDLSNLKMRLMTSVHHALYDLITEHLVLTSPLFPDVECSNDTLNKESSQNSNSIDLANSDSKDTFVSSKNMPLSLLVFQWMKEGRNIESPLVTDVSTSLSSCLFVEQLISDLLKPFISHDDNSVLDSSPNTISRKQDSTTDFTCVSIITGGTFSPSESAASSNTKSEAKCEENVEIFKPGFTNKYIIVGRNRNAWKRALNVTQTGQQPKSIAIPKSLDKTSHIWLIEFTSDSGIYYDASSRMQPLKVNISPNICSVNIESNPPIRRLYRNDEASTCEARFLSNNDAKKRVTQSSDFHWCLTDSCCNSALLVSKFPEFCPVKIGMIQHTSADTNDSAHLDQTDRSDSNEFLFQNYPILQEKYGINIHIPRQSFCLIYVNGRHIQMFTYNWTKEEAERMSNRLLLSVEWYNQRYQLLCSLSFQKLGLFHAISNSAFRGCAARAMDLIRNTCPPELNIGTDSPCTAVSQTSSNLYNTSPLSSVSSTPNAQISVSSISMNILSAVTSIARRRNVTPSTADMNTNCINSSNIFHTPSSPAFQTHSSSLHGTNNSRMEFKEHKSINNFLRLFQDCGYIPPLIPPSNPNLPYIDMLQRYSEQALTLMHADIRRSQYIELFSEYFRNWQEGGKNNTANKESNPVKSIPVNKDTGQKFSHSKSAVGSAKELLPSDQLFKRLQRYSAIKQACRHLHTICTPILFCPNTRSKVVQLIKEEENAMNKTAQLYFSSISRHSSAATPTDITVTSANNTDSTISDLTVHKEIGDSDKIHYHTEQATNQCKSSENESGSSKDFSVKSTPVRLKQVSDAGGSRFLSPWLSWSHNSATPGNLDDTNILSTDILLADNNSCADNSHHHDSCFTSVLNFNNWLRRVAHQFLMKYSQYLQQEVGFHSIPIFNSSVSLNRREQAAKPYINYALFRRSIHLAGVHIIELFVRDFHLFVRLGTIEVSRFSWHASRSVTLGPYTSEVISQTAASAAASMTSVMFNAVFRRNMERSFRSPSANSSFNIISSPSDGKYSDWFEYSSNLSWNESSKLCDYTHLHSFSYDFHLRAIQDYLENRRCFQRSQCSDASRRQTSAVGSVYSNVITIPDYPVTKFLEDLTCIAQKLPLFSRGYLCCFPVTCHVSLCLRPDQVFHHLIEEHASYGVDILRMTRREYSASQTNPPYNKHLSYNFALVEQCHPEQESGCCSSRSTSSDHHSKYQPCSNLRMSSESNSSSTTNSKDQSCKFSALGIASAHHIVENLTKLDSELSNRQSISQPYSVTGIVVPDEVNGTYSDIRSPVDGSITNRLLHLVVYLIILDSKHEFPESRLAKLNSSSCTQCPVDWPAIRPCVDPCSFTYQPTLVNRIPKPFGIEDTDISSLTAERQCQNLNISPTDSGDYRRFSKHSENTFDSDVRWHMSYLSMCPSHQVQLHRVLRISQSNLESRITQLIGRSGVDCHKNLLWYKLFDTNSSLATQILSTNSRSLSQDAVETNCRVEDASSISLGTNLNPVDSYLCPVLNHQSLSMREIEELVDSAPFQLDILRLDPRLIELFNVGGCHLNSVSVLLNKEFIDLQQSSHHQIDQMKLTISSKLYKYSTSETIPCIAYRFSHSVESKLDEVSNTDRQCTQNYMVLLSPSFTEGLIFLSWCESSNDECVLDEYSTVYTSCPMKNTYSNGVGTRKSSCFIDAGENNAKAPQSHHMEIRNHKYKDFQFRAVFRAVGDPTNPSSMRRLIDSGSEIQNLFFKTSTLALVATNFIEKLSFFVWKTLHN
uniref:Protein SZT2 n=1 Tax=Schistosoma haematobium TaxID=6185 RepID=A0A094ZZ82_SCHHA